MSDKTALGDRMKAYERATRSVLPRRAYTILRVDGRAFHTFLRDAHRPFDRAVMDAMNGVGAALCEEITGSVFAYVQSDECSVLMTDFATPSAQPWFGGVTQKIVSVAASIATIAFNEAYATGGVDGRRATFDARAFTLADPCEVANYFRWRQNDCVRNSITMAAQARFSHRELHGRSTGQMQEMLWAEHGVNWNDYDAGAKRGRVVVRETGRREVAYRDGRTGEAETTLVLRSWWQAQAAPRFTAGPDEWLATVIPAMPSLTAGRIG
ncbi:tRNA(His) guanylyltransferase Thg1 family protein [Microbispora sp. NPDC046933]|uniref:tRNA(His) guanylyltransferase Thg1 family protein n=1 Tax=Microbispora sp. NPDC046933 TaxID=3155618 RepID=UPI0033CE82C5